jgi:hypothetical protein
MSLKNAEDGLDPVFAREFPVLCTSIAEHPAELAESDHVTYFIVFQYKTKSLFKYENTQDHLRLKMKIFLTLIEIKFFSAHFRSSQIVDNKDYSNINSENFCKSYFCHMKSISVF